MLFMLAAPWADDIRMQAKLQREARWHYINFPFKPTGESEDIKPLAPHPDNILSALAENQRIVKSQASADQRAIALAWLLHLIGDVHQPLHTIQLFSREYPHGDRGGDEVCIRLAPGRAPLDLHRLWDGVITSTNNVGRLRNIATELLSKFSRLGYGSSTKSCGRVGEGKLRDRCKDCVREWKSSRNPKGTGSGLPRGAGRELHIPRVSRKS
jgi:hypothetical protein